MTENFTKLLTHWKRIPSGGVSVLLNLQSDESGVRLHTIDRAGHDLLVRHRTVQRVDPPHCTGRSGHSGPWPPSSRWYCHNLEDFGCIFSFVFL